jgi:ADP-ribosylglycohydrolase
MTDEPQGNRFPCDHHARLERARLSLDGLSVGDAFGQRFFYPPSVESLIAERALPQPPWHYTDDTEMALAIVETLDRHGQIDRNELARAFARRYRANPARGYGGMAHEILMSIGAGEPWSVAAGRVFGGAGSLGNGGAMRAAPIGAYWADDYDRVIREARASAEVTHAHPEGQAGAIAVAIAAAWAARRGSGGRTGSAIELLEAARVHTPPGETRTGLERALTLPLDRSVQSAASLLGSGLRVTSQDTVPFTLWCAARHIDNYAEAMWATVAGLGDRDTTCAIVGGIVVLATGKWSIPEEWLDAREPLAFFVGT